MHPLVRTARATGLFYLGLAITGLLGFIVVRQQLFTPGDAQATLANLVQHESLARVGVALELGVVGFQALAAAWFYRLFRGVDSFAASGIAAFGLMNSAIILTSAACLGVAVQVATEPFGDAASTVQLMYVLTAHLWGVGGLFFGLWLIPMGLCVLRSQWMPRALGWVLVAGGCAYILSTLIAYLLPGARVVADALPFIATVGEFWMIGYLLIRGVNRRATTQ